MSLPGRGLSFCVTVSNTASPAPTVEGTLCPGLSCVHQETSILFSPRLSNDPATSPRPLPLGRGSLPDEVGA